nr:unnamed protein product [Callosobruchus chinensis]
MQSREGQFHSSVIGP